ncbi:ATP-binding cassette sub-family C member 9-like [Amphiura filiformis]|uniref:ATP-binding cassette sub-family C member 9-like n=1 Tax=Amphiura filiformis TaxID=82378 RepID=UPI003B224D5D
MATEDENRWSWFCHETNISSEAGDDGAYMTECTVNFAAFLLHLLFVIIACLVLIWRRWCCVFRDVTLPYLIKWPGHNTRWILSFLLVVLAIASLGEGILTEMARKEPSPQLQFYLPACLLLIATIVSVLYYQLTENWKSPGLLWLLLAYWFFCIIINIMRITHLFQENVAGIDAAILWITVLLLVSYVLLLVLELNLVTLKVCRIREEQYDASSSESNNDDMWYTEYYVSFLYYITFWWMNWVFKLGFQRPLEIKDLGSLPKNHRAEHLYEIFKVDFQKELEYQTSIGKSPSVWKVFLRVFKGEIFWAGITRLIYDIMCLVGPLALNGIVAYAIAYGEEIETHYYITVKEFFLNGYILVGVMFLANILQFFSWQQNLYLSNVIGLHIRTSLQTMVYDKALRLSSYTISGGSMTVGQITNHMSTDAFNLFFFCQRMHYLWAVPLRLITVTAMLYLQVDLATFLALGTILIFVPVQLITAQIQTKKQKLVMKNSDERLKQSNEMLLGIKLLKMYGWEEMFCKAIEAVRNLEMSSIFSYNGCYSINLFIVQCTPILMNLTVYISYPYFTGKPLEPNTTFAAQSLMNLLLEPMFFVPMITSLLVNAFIGVRRFEAFFAAPETERSHEIQWMEYFSKDKKKPTDRLHQKKRQNYYANEKTPILHANGTDYESVLSQTDQEATRLTRGLKCTNALKIVNGDFTWGSDSSAPILKDINLEIPYGELTMVIGGVGSGKSSLLSAILGEMTTLKGSITFGKGGNETESPSSSGVAYGAQKAWLMNATLRDNVLFGVPYNQSRYRKVIDACALKPDIDILPGGDMTEIGEKGINLSGGQKQRVSVARTMYSNKPIVLLDDPLSALDVNVGGHLFRDGIMGRLRKANRTVVLVSHQLQYLQQAEKIVVMEEGQITFQGNFDDMVRSDPGLHQRWQQDVIAATDSELSDGVSGDESTVEERHILRRRVSESLLKSQSEHSMSKSTLAMEESSKGKLIQTEELARGSVSAKTYWYYARNMGMFWAISFPFARVVLESFTMTRNFWLADWSEAGLNPNTTVGDISQEFVGPYIGFACACLVMSIFFNTSMLFSTWNAAKDVYLRMLRNIVKAPNRFFDTTPIGRILNRFSSDTQIIDTKIIFTLGMLFNFISTFVFAIIVNSIITPIFIAEIIPIIAIYVVLAVYFIRSSRELQRLDSVTRSPVFAHFSETLGGLTTLRAYSEQKKFFGTLLKRIDTNNTAFLYLQAGYGWLGLQMSICGGIVVLVVGLTTLLQATVFGSLDSSSVGLALSYVLMVSIQLFNLVRSAADTEMQMNPVERVQYYAGVPTEHYGGKEPPSDWPSRGAIQIEHVSVRYDESLPPVLQDVTVYVQPGEKVGICGRTGSGKSSLTLSLLRIIETFKGKIIIDGENIALMPLTTLRQRLSIIPQDPILFTGTIRTNLDPNSSKSDKELWNALEIAQLKPIVSEFDLGLDTPVSEGGENFSVGQRQLFCLARAFLRNSRVLIMDEATASIDYNTEKLLQEVVGSAFEDKTVLTIAHRVSTIRESDTIWVLSNGELIECDSPGNLLARESSEFYSMVQANK